MLKRSLFALVPAVVGMLAFAAPASAHEVRQVGDLEMVVGWAEEPAYAGFRNAVEVFLSTPVEPGRTGERAEGGTGPVEDAELTVAVFFGEEGSEVSTEPLQLEAAFGEAGAYDTSIIPTRPGTYTFQFTGTAGGQEIDEVFTSGPEFDDVRNPADSQFPEQDPTAGEIADRLDRIDARLAEIGAGGGSLTVPIVIAGIAALLALGALAISLRRSR